MKKTLRSTLILGALTMSFACTEQVPSEIDQAALEAIQEESYRAHIKTLSDDSFMGRKPFTKGDTLTVAYIEEQFRALGLKPGNGDSYIQEVPLVQLLSTPSSNSLKFENKSQSFSINFLDDYVIGSNRMVEDIEVAETELVFAGFGIVAPEYGWNDYEGLDVKGKTVVVMVNDPGFYDKSLFKGETMTYYGRWTYKFEEASRQGATGALIIHDTGAASYGWEVVRNGWSGPQLNMEAADKGMSRPAFEGWLSTEATEKLFKLAGHEDPAALLETAKKTGFKPVPLGVTTGVKLKNTFRTSFSNNVIAKIEGSKRPDEVIIYTAHWDHLGIGEETNGDAIFNGAIDNATGVAALFEIAKGFKAAAVQPERSIIFLAVTAEEEGLLGSKYYAENPIYPLGKTVANINMDSFSPIGKTSDIAVVGLGQSEMDDYMSKVAEKHGKSVIAGGNPAAGSFFRSDHFNFAKVGVPALYAGQGRSIIGMDPEEATSLIAGFGKNYHTVKDEYTDDWFVQGILEDLRILLDVGYTLSMEKTFPKWKTGSEFKEAGENRK